MTKPYPTIEEVTAENGPWPTLMTRENVVRLIKIICDLDRERREAPAEVDGKCHYCGGDGEVEDNRDGPNFPATEACPRCGGSGKSKQPIGLPDLIINEREMSGP